MRKIIHLILLLSCITVLVYSLPLTLNDDSGESSSSSSSSSSSEESKEENTAQPPSSSKVQSSTTQLDNSTQNEHKIQKRDNTVVHTNAHQGAPDQTNRASSLPPNTLKESGYQPNQNRQTRDTSNENKPPSLSTSNLPRVDNQHKNLETSNNNNNNPNRQNRDTNNQETPSKVIASNLSPVSSTREPQFGVKTHKFDNDQNRQARDTRDQETPAKVIVSNPNPVHRQPESSTYDLKSQTANSDVKSNRQVRDSGDQDTPSKTLTSNPSSLADSDKYSNINSGTANGQGTDTNKRILASFPSSVSSTENSNNYQNRQVRNIEPDETSSGADRSFDLSSSSSTDSSSTSSSSTTSTTKHSIFTPEETTTDSKVNDYKETDTNENSPKVSSTQEPGDVYNDYLRKITAPSREIRDSSNIENIPSVYKSYPSQGSSTEIPASISNVHGGNTPTTSNLNTDHLNPSLTSYNQGSTKIPDDTNSEYHISGSNQHKRDTSEEDTSKVLTPSRSADVSTLKADEIPVNVQNEDSKQRKLRETSTENSKPTEQSDDVKVVKLNDTPPYPKRQQ